MPVSGLTREVTSLFIREPLPNVALRLSDGTRWFIQGDRRIIQWIDSLVSIMGLRYATEGEPHFTLQMAPISSRWHLYKSASNRNVSTERLIHESGFPSSFDETQWECLDFRTLRIWHEHNSHNFSAKSKLKRTRLFDISTCGDAFIRFIFDRFKMVAFHFTAR